ncbi:hypothetical protein H8S90_13025 [Olivibacter sp. SDN3]|uniref:hypothetical protein n=1 Tax=Olivibacter sp. SDN3 TaxID=2764720 RepID=UPI001651B13A|nr:hypothetical protein [Olivibacter sp. SDN3]QNL47746.1 hypothetical protein H8S90_13025 [Olivibacter sp. SDN3]
MQTKEPFDVTFNDVDYAVFPEEDNTYTIFKDGVEYIKIMKDTESSWLKLDPETELPRFEADDEINAIGKEIIAYQSSL